MATQPIQTEKKASLPEMEANTERNGSPSANQGLSTANP